MSQCNNCYNGCAVITSDKCVKYTGANFPDLNIETGDTLLSIEESLATFLTSILDGTGITIIIDEADYCALVTQYLVSLETVTVLDLFKALVKAACNLQVQIDAEKARINIIEADYTIDCLTGVAAGDGTHAIVQAVITKLCEVNVALTALALDVDTNYVKLSELNALIAAYIATTTSSTRYSSKMIPYVAQEYYGPLTGFDSTGAGILGTEWEDIYLCNGDNGTPDKRGRVAVGATSTPGVLAMDNTVNPAISGNPAYTVLDTAHGANTIILNTTQLPAHNHTATTVISPNPHTHTIGLTEDSAGNLVATGGQNAVATQESSSVNLTATTTVQNTGNGLPHDNYQPGIGAYYIMYIPA